MSGAGLESYLNPFSFFCPNMSEKIEMCKNYFFPGSSLNQMSDKWKDLKAVQNLKYSNLDKKKSDWLDLFVFVKDDEKNTNDCNWNF